MKIFKVSPLSVPQFLRATVFVSFVLLCTSHALASAPPEEMIEVLGTSECWQSSAFNAFGTQMVPIVHKKWRFIRIENSLVELTNSSIGRDPLGNPAWISKKIDLTQELSLEDLTNFPFKIDLTYTKLPNFQVLLEAEMGFKFRTVLFPSACDPKPARRFQGEIGIGSTPFGLLAPQIPYSDPSRTFYIHHENSARVWVKLDVSFPSKFRPSVRKALLSWNRAIGRDVYVLSSKRDKIDPLSCLTSHTLCISWEGSDDLGWIGWGGITSMIFDPISGSILGATVMMSNLSTKPLESTPPELALALENPTMGTLASIHLRKEEFKKYRHTHPDMLVTHILIHEIGHANGLRHDFSASNEARFQEPSSSVMEYLPFGVTHWMDHLGRRDLRRLNVVYRNGNPSNSLSDCSDEREMHGADPNCSKNDVGRPLRWYKALCDRGDRGVFTTVVEQLSGLPERPYISILQKFLANPVVSEPQSREATEFLCRQPDRSRITETLKTAFSKRLECEGDFLPQDKRKNLAL